MRHFTPEEANEALPEIRPFVQEMVARRAAHLDALGRQEELEGSIRGNGGGIPPATLAAAAAEVESEARELARVIDEIVAGVQRGNQLVGEIAEASTEQSTGLAEINKAIVQLERVTQENAALVEEAAAKSLSFQEEADRLIQVVARFRISAQAPMPAPASRGKPLPLAGAMPLKRRLARGAANAEHAEWKEF